MILQIAETAANNAAVSSVHESESDGVGAGSIAEDSLTAVTATATAIVDMLLKKYNTILYLSVTVYWVIIVLSVGAPGETGGGTPQRRSSASL